ncbi:MAG TPA: YoaK family protein [Chloroflexota bacterium]
MAAAASERRQAWFAICLGAVGGGVDAIGYLTLWHIFTAHMTGNTVSASLRAAEGQWRAALAQGVVIPLFVLGVALGAVAVEVGGRLGVRRPTSVALVLEAALLLGALLLGAEPGPSPADVAAGASGLSPFIALLALAMGLQNTALRRVGSLPVRTSYITGVLTALAEEAVRAFFRWLDRAPGHPHDAARTHHQQEALGRVGLLAGLWAAYVAGALVGVWAEARWEGRGLGVPLILLGILIAADLARPVRVPSTAGRSL